MIEPWRLLQRSGICSELSASDKSKVRGGIKLSSKLGYMAESCATYIRYVEVKNNTASMEDVGFLWISWGRG